MTLHKKTSIIIGSTLAGLLITLLAVSRAFLLDGYLELERTETRRNLERVILALDNDIAYLEKLTEDWAFWDDTYAFIETKSPQYIKSNLNDQTLANQGLNMVMYLNSDGRLVYGKGFDLQTGKATPPPPGVDKVLPLLLSGAGSTSGIIMLADGPMLVASEPILTSNGTGPSRGALVMGRYLDDKRIGVLSQLTNLSVRVFSLHEKDMPPDVQEAVAALGKDTPFYARPLDRRHMAGYALLKDICGQPGLVMKISLPRDIYARGLEGLAYFAVWLLIAGLAFGLVVRLLLEKAVLSRLSRLDDCMKDISAREDFSARVAVEGKDEITRLAADINGMLDSLEQARDRLRESEEQYRRLFEKGLTGNFVVTPGGKLILCNDAFVRIFGFDSVEEALNTPVQALYRSEDDRETFLKLLNEKKRLKNYELEMVSRDGRSLTVVENVIGVFDSEGRLQKIEGYLFDITERKQMEEQLRYQGTHDALTGLYNRAHFEQQMRRLEKERRHPTGIIVCDVDGLKLVNDTLGHGAGDQLLAAAARVLRQSFRQEDLLARIGGDEFAVLLPECGRDVVEMGCRRIQESLARYNAANPQLPLNLSTGFAVGERELMNLNELYKEADNNMYREKLLHKQSSRSAVVQALMKALEARDFITEGHTDRLQSLVASMGRALGLAGHRIADLCLLARFHDIGKVGIPDRILFKQGPLDDEETREMQRHCEIGHRIALSVPELKPVADWILKHHEWWNGQGYPLGLKGEEIPLECRILAIADAYDAMTSDRPYRRAMTAAEAARELDRCAGKQFDPRLVRLFLQLPEHDNKINSV